MFFLFPFLFLLFFSLLLLQLSTNRCLLSSFPRISLPIQFIRWRCKAKEPLPHLFPRSRGLSNFWLSPNPLRDANDSLPRQRRHQALKYPAEEQSSDISRFHPLFSSLCSLLQKRTSTGPWNRTGLNRTSRRLPGSLRSCTSTYAFPLHYNTGNLPAVALAPCDSCHYNTTLTTLPGQLISPLRRGNKGGGNSVFSALALAYTPPNSFYLVLGPIARLELQRPPSLPPAYTGPVCLNPSITAPTSTEGYPREQIIALNLKPHTIPAAEHWTWKCFRSQYHRRRLG